MATASMIISNKNKEKIIETKFPLTKFLKICLSLGKNITDVDEAKKFTDEEIRRIFLEATGLFINGKLDLDEFSDISGFLYEIFLKSYPGKDALNNALMAGAELSYYVRTNTNNNMFENFKSEILAYYDQNAHR